MLKNLWRSARWLPKASSSRAGGGAPPSITTTTTTGASGTTRTTTSTTAGKRTIAPTTSSSTATTPSTPTTARISKLSNGVRVVSEDAPGHFVSVGVFVDAGSRYEPSHLRGLTHFCDRMAFKSTHRSTRAQITSAMERLGGNISCSSSRECIIYQSMVFRHHVDEVMALLAETIRQPTLADHEIHETRRTMDYECRESFSTKPEFLLPELVHATAFQGNTLGHPQFCAEDMLASVQRRHLDKYRSLFYRPENLVVAGVGMDHESMLAVAEKYFGDMPASDPVVNPTATATIATTQQQQHQEERHAPARYTGGVCIRQRSDLPFTQIALAFPGASFQGKEGADAAEDDNDLYALSTLQIMLGGGDSFSAGGPGKGMYSRLYTNVLNRYHWVETVVASHLCYKDAGILAFHASVPAQGVPAILDLLGVEIRKLIGNSSSSSSDGNTNTKSTTTIDPVELERAKNQLRSALFMNLESKLVHLEDLGRQTQMMNRCVSPQEMSRRIQAVTQHDIQRVLRKAVTTAPPTIVLLGEADYLPDLEQFRKKFGFQ